MNRLLNQIGEKFYLPPEIITEIGSYIRCSLCGNINSTKSVGSENLCMACFLCNRYRVNIGYCSQCRSSRQLYHIESIFHNELYCIKCFLQRFPILSPIQRDLISESKAISKLLGYHELWALCIIFDDIIPSEQREVIKGSYSIPIETLAKLASIMYDEHSKHKWLKSAIKNYNRVNHLSMNTTGSKYY